ncbi:DUF3150 domain-containing protein [Photobacterium sp. ZSDE20]|uniref:DUF3150 domain-containing protein n=1 Tax=Photobacterium pectinilyticum TaxID=2906793 RepID=A0ABT1N795_9GAMM|nr:DUF3150 domain-containing protein [Photobacterium sp. ZSDE20]MCQ1060620.1 DUF3150 domain-containing protein [Photobacterium sp. ZSDE20]MDD1827815.1 DUF3150 domain-containing protein [Photobacterium sp. ZSDE20]
MSQNSTTDIQNKALNNSLKATQNQTGLFCLVRFTVKGFAARRVLSDAEVRVHGLDVSKEKALGKPSLSIVDSGYTAFAHRARDEAKAKALQWGFHFGRNEYLIKMENIAQLYDELFAIEDEFWSEVDNFITNIDVFIEEQKVLYPDLASAIEAKRPTQDQLKRTYRFKIEPPQAIGIHQDAGAILGEVLVKNGRENIMNKNDDLVVQLSKGISDEARHFWRYSMQSYRESGNRVRATIIDLMKRLRTKVEDVTLINPDFSRVVDVIDSAAEALPNGWNTQDAWIEDVNALKRIVDIYESLKVPEYITELVLNNSSTQDLLESAEVETKPESISIDELTTDQVERPVAQAKTTKNNIDENEIVPLSNEAIDLSDLFADTQQESLPASEPVLDEPQPIEFDSLFDVFKKFI